MARRSANAGRSGLGLGHLGKEAKPKAPAEPGTTKTSRRRGRTGEDGVVDLFRRHGWTKEADPLSIGARRSPSSGGLRFSRDDEDSPFPGDVSRAHPWEPIEVKNTAAVDVPGRGRGWLGEAFVRRTMRKTIAAWTVRGGRRTTRPAGFFRAARRNAPYRVAVREVDFLVRIEAPILLATRGDADAVVLVSPEEFFDWLAGRPYEDWED